MYSYRDSYVHSLDPRNKLFFQLVFAATAFVYTDIYGLTGLSVLVLVSIHITGLSLINTLNELRFILVLLAAAPVVEGVALMPPWFFVEDAVSPALASFRVLLVLLMGYIYVSSTTERESRAAVEFFIPGKPGKFLGLGSSFVIRFFPLLRTDMNSIMNALRARLGNERPLKERIQIVVALGLNKMFTRSDNLSLALRTRCLSWNPTQPDLELKGNDIPVLLLSMALIALTLLRVNPL